MNTKSFQLFALSFIAILLGSLGHQSPAHAAGDDAVLESTYVITDYKADEFKDFHCGKVEDTSVACVEDFRTCLRGIEGIFKNARNSCELRPADCRVLPDYDLRMNRTGYDYLIADPIYLYSKQSEVAAIKDCRVLHPKSEDQLAPAAPPAASPSDAETQERLRRERAEAGELPVQENAAPVQQPEVLANVPQVNPADADQNVEASGGGCSLQFSHASATAFQGLLVMLLVLLPFAATSLQLRK